MAIIAKVKGHLFGPMNKSERYKSRDQDFIKWCSYNNLLGGETIYHPVANIL